MTEPGGPHTLVQCVGAPFRRDDGVGQVIAQALRERVREDTVAIETHWGEGGRLMASWTGWRRVYIVDAAKSGAAPGTIHRIDASRRPVPANFLYYSTHRFGVAEAVETARALGLLPAELWLYCIEGEDFGAGEGLSDPVRSAARKLLDELAPILTAAA